MVLARVVGSLHNFSCGRGLSWKESALNFSGASTRQCAAINRPHFLLPLALNIIVVTGFRHLLVVVFVIHVVDGLMTVHATK